jgi:hypothetical protein
VRLAVSKFQVLTVAISAAAVIGAALLFLNESTPMTGSIKVSLDFHRSAHSLDPANIVTSYEYELIWNLYSRLVEHDRDMQLIAGAPESFTVDGRTVTFRFGTKTKTHSGHVLDAQDAATSLKRLIIFGKSSHGDIRRLLCPDHKLLSVKEDCPGIRVADNKLILSTSEPYQIPLLVEALTSADYSIIPQSNLDEALKISDISETTGPYYVESDSTDGRLVLRANHLSYRFNTEMPETIHLTPMETSSGILSLRSGLVDIVPVTEYYRKILMEPSDEVSFNYHKTLPLKLSLVKFSPHALSVFTPDQRMYVGNEIARAVLTCRSQYYGTPTMEFFPSLSDGGLSEQQRKELFAFRKSLRKPKFHKPITLAVTDKSLEIFSRLLADVPELKVVSLKGKSIFEIEKNDLPDAYIVATDASWTEDVNLIGYNFNTGTFFLPNVNSDQWMEKYLRLDKKEERIKLLNKLHFDLLMNASFIPIDIAPYFAFSKPDWTLELSRFQTVTEFWRIRKKSK